ncbi:MAG: PQQ-dependent sugar dehydrogenase, partial [Actinomycetota bacterium]
GNDGLLYIATGDAGRDPRGNPGSGGANDAGTDRSLLNGKILRVDRFTGVAAPGNPFTGAGTAACRLRGNEATTPTTTCQEIFATGLRNPFRFAFDPNTNATRFFINDVGQSTREEVNEGVIGADYGWNSREGLCPRGLAPPCPGPPVGLTDPILDYGREAGTFITAGAFVPDGHWPAEFDGGYLFADGGVGRVYFRDSAGITDFGQPFHTVTGGIVDLAFGFQSGRAELWYATSSGRVGKIVPPIETASADSGPLVLEPLPVIDRRFDSRTLEPATPLRGGTTRLIDVDAPADAVAAVVNLTYVRPARTGFITPWLSRTARPTVSNVNATTDEVSANLSILPLRDAAVSGDDGRAMLYVSSTAHVIVDVVGFYVPAAGAIAAGRFETVDPFRLADTRPDEPVPGVFTRAGDRVTVPVVGRPGLPEDADQIAAVVVVLTGVNRDGAARGFLTANPAGAELPLASNLNINQQPDARANLAIVPIGAGGAIDVTLSGVSHVAVDVVGWITGDGAPAASTGRFHLVAPDRAADSRIGVGLPRLQPAVVRTLDPTAAPAGASALAVNLTMVGPAAPAFVTAWPSGERPTASTGNAVAAGQVRPAMAWVPTDDGSISLAAGAASTDLVVDVFGWFD